jgi:hypothetical protein
VNNSPSNFNDPSGHKCGPEDGCETPHGDPPDNGPWTPPPGTFENGNLPETKKVYDLYIGLYNTPGWWNGNQSGNFTAWQFLNLLLSMEFQNPGTNWSPALLQETVVRNFYYLSPNGNSADPLQVLIYIALKDLTIAHDVTPGSLVKNEVNRHSYNSTDFTSAFKAPDQVWKSGSGDGNVPYDWGNTSLAECTASTCPWMDRSVLENLQKVKVRFNYAVGVSPYAGAGEAPSIQANMFYSIAGYGNTAFIVTLNQNKCLYQGIGCP